MEAHEIRELAMVFAAERGMDCSTEQLADGNVQVWTPAGGFILIRSGHGWALGARSWNPFWSWAKRGSK